MSTDLKRLREITLEDGPSKRRALSHATPPIEDSEDDRQEDWMKVVEVS